MNNGCVVYGVLENLSSTPGRNDKIAILETYKGHPQLKQVLYYALNPYLQYNIKKIPKYESNEGSVMSIDTFMEHLSMFTDREVTGNAAIETLKELLESLTPEAAKVAEKIIKKDLRCGVQASTVNKVFEELIPTYPCLLGKGYDEKTIKSITYPAYSQLKADGMRINIIYRQDLGGAGSVTVRGRSGKLVDLLGHLDNAFTCLGNAIGGDVVFDGELVVLEDDGSVMSRKKGNGILNKAVKGTINPEEAARVRVRLWDLISYSKFIQNFDETMYVDRFIKLREYVEENPNELYRMIETKEVDSLEQALEHFEWAIALGEEGTMLKNMIHPWEDKRSKHLIKMKSEKECELRVVGWQEGTGKYNGMLGALVCESECGKLRVSIGSGFTDEERKTIGPDVIRSIISTRYNEKIISKDTGIYSLFLPRYLEVRLDKQVADTLEQIK